MPFIVPMPPKIWKTPTNSFSWQSTEKYPSTQFRPMHSRLNSLRLTPTLIFDPKISPEDMFDPYRDQHTGIILGIAISSRKFAKEDGTITDIHMVRPGDDVQIMFPTVGANAKPVSENCTVVDFYSSNMHEYDSTFAFMPLSELQKIRGMVDPVTKDASVSAIQIKLKDGADLNRGPGQTDRGVFLRRKCPMTFILGWIRRRRC
jgi:hypothetical protein